jgi:hypothetical protein
MPEIISFVLKSPIAVTIGDEAGKLAVRALIGQ